MDGELKIFKSSQPSVFQLVQVVMELLQINVGAAQKNSKNNFTSAFVILDTMFNIIQVAIRQLAIFALSVLLNVLLVKI